jgi:hypothetical protein
MMLRNSATPQDRKIEVTTLVSCVIDLTMRKLKKARRAREHIMGQWRLDRKR